MGKPSTPKRSATDPLVVLVRHPDPEPEQIAEYARACEQRASTENFGLVVYRTRTRRVHTPKGVKGRNLLEPNDAYRLYDQLHYSPVLVFALIAAFVSKEPGLDEPPERLIVGLADFIMHKAVFRHVRDAKHVNEGFRDLAAWRRGTHCTGEDDPRVLPFHVFSSGCDRAYLGTEAGDETFIQRHGSPSSRRDDTPLVWNRADRGAYHGRPELCVAGRLLPRGMHWDVASGRHEQKVRNSREVWRVTVARNSYVNVYPNAHILAPRKKSSARKVWPLPG